jgi:hypothetical protein
MQAGETPIGRMVRSARSACLERRKSGLPTCALNMPISDKSEIGRAASSFETPAFAMLRRAPQDESD